MNPPTSKLSFNATWSMAVGGMVGGGIFSTLGVVIGIAGAWAWLSFAAAGLIALAAGYSYVKLAIHYDEGGGAFTFLREINADGFAAVGTLTSLVEAASLTFLFTFAVVCGLAFYQRAGARIITGFGVLAGATATVALIIRLIANDPLALGSLGLLVLIAMFGRPVLLRHVKTESRHG